MRYDHTFSGGYPGSSVLHMMKTLYLVIHGPVSFRLHLSDGLLLHVQVKVYVLLCIISILVYADAMPLGYAIDGLM